MYGISETVSAIGKAYLAALDARLAASGARPMRRRDPYPLKQKPTPSYWSGFAPLAVPLFYACGLVAVMCGAVWLVRVTF